MELVDEEAVPSETLSDRSSDLMESMAEHQLDDSDYSSDSSFPDPNTASVPDAHTPSGRRRRQSRPPAGAPAASGGTDLTTVGRDSVFPQLYRFTDHQTKGSRDAEGEEGPVAVETENVRLQNLRDLVNYSSSDLLSRAWHLAPVMAKNREFPLFSILPSGPDVLSERFSDPSDVSKYMCATAIKLAERFEHPTPVYLRSLLVQAAVRDEAERTRQGMVSANTLDDASLTPKWESELTDDDADDYESAIDTDSVSAVDFTMALALPTIGTKLPPHRLALLHRIVNKCIQSGNTEMLSSWGVQLIMRVTLRQIEDEANSEQKDMKWLETAVALLYKYVVSAQLTGMLLSVFRWTYRHAACAKALHVAGLGTLVKQVEGSNERRARLVVPSLLSKGHLTSFTHSVDSTCEEILGLCVLHDETDHGACVLLTRGGALKVSLRPPFSVLSQNRFYVPEECHGVIVEDADHIAVLGPAGEAIDVLDAHTLMKLQSVNPPSSGVSTSTMESKRSDGAPLLYLGQDRFVTPHFICGGHMGRHAYLHPDKPASGKVEPATIQLPRTTDSLSVQFFLHPIPTLLPTSFTLISMTAGERVWLSVKVQIVPSTSTVTITFEHGGDAVVEVTEPLQPEWALWSATLSASNDTASWTVYRNGCACEVKGKTGTLLRPLGGGLYTTLLDGTFSGYITSIMVWGRAHSIGDMRLAAMEGLSQSTSQFLICAFRMDEGVGTCLHSQPLGMQWRGSQLQWAVPPRPLPVKPHPPEKLLWKPTSSSYYLTTNGYEALVVEPDVTTWINEDGRIVEQRTTRLHPSDCCFACPVTGSLFLAVQDSIGIREVPTSTFAAHHMRQLASIKRGEAYCTELTATVTQQRTCTASAVAMYAAYRLNASLLSTATELPVLSESLAAASEVARSAPGIVGRLLSMCKELQQMISSNAAEDYEELLLCICGRLLVQQTKLLGRQCPSSVVPSIVEVYRFLQGRKAKGIDSPYLSEALHVFTQLHRVVLAECVTHDYQLRLILDCAELKEVKQLLVPDNIPPLVTSVIEKNLKKPFMNFLSRLKDECQKEADCIFRGTPVELDASAAMLTAILGMLAQKEKSEWHLVATALLHSICKAVLKRFQELFPTVEARAEQLHLLKQTAVGVVMFPVVHYLYDMEFDLSVATDALKALNNTRNQLRPYVKEQGTAATTTTTTVGFRLSETHSITTPPQLSTPFTAMLDLQHVKSIRAELAPGSTAEVVDRGTRVYVALIANDCTRTSDELTSSGEVTFGKGGLLCVTCVGPRAAARPAAAESATDLAGGGQGVSIVVHAAVELMVEQTDWVRDICVALSHAIVKLTHRTQLLLTAPVQPLPRDSVFRGGLTPQALKQHGIPAQDMDDETATTHTALCAVANNDESLLTSHWRDTYTAKRFPYQNRLTTIVRWSSCALAWHSLRPGGESTVEQELSKALDVLKRKAFLLLEAMQQGREASIVARARFLLLEVMPRVHGEAQLAEQQHTEEPVTSGGAGGNVSRGGGYSRGTRSMDRRSRALMSRQRMGVEGLGTSRASRVGLSFSKRPATSGAAAVSIFSKGLRDQSESVPSQILDFLISSASDNTAEMTSDLLSRTRQALAHTSAYRLQEELCKASSGDSEMLSSILVSHLKYRYTLCETTNAEEGEVAASHLNFHHHYTENSLGCGLLRELELQKSACGFVQAALQVLLRKLESHEEFPFMEALEMCAVLCQPWDGVDMSVLQPTDIFAFLKLLISAAFQLRLNSLTSSDPSRLYLEGRGLFDLFHRCLVLPNVMLQVSVDGVHVVDGEVQGLHVENTNVVCSARNHWKPLTHDLHLRSKRGESDLYANYGLPCVVSELPDVLYFEVTLDLVTQGDPKVSVGLSNVPLAAVEMVRLDSAIVFTSDGLVSHGVEAAIRFSETWRVGDVIGCGVLAPHNSVFFTRNGEFLGVATNSSFGTLIPFVQVQAVNSLMKVIVNFGGEQPFKFNIASIHSSCRHRYLTSSTVCDTALITVHYLVTMCYKNLSSDEETATTNRDAVSGLLERAASFLNRTILDLIQLLNARQAELIGEEEDYERQRLQEPVLVLISRLFHCVLAVIECFQFDSVTPRTHAKILQLCAQALTTVHDKWVKVRAAQCLSLVREVMRDDSLVEAAESFRRVLPAEEIVHHLVELARVRLIKEEEVPLPPPKWMGNTTTVRGKGTFFGSVPMPSKGTHMVGFRIRRRHQQGQGVGSPLGGCYYVGLCHGQPPIANMANLLSRPDVYALQDTDDQDQVPHLLLRRHCIPRNGFRRIYGNDEVVWVELNADLGEITFYRENMVLIGLAFANIPRVDDLFPIVYHFNDDASCEIVPPPVLNDESASHWTENLRRSAAIHTLQQLHLVPYFSSVISQVVHRSITQLDRSLESCLVALAVLGGERSYLFCQHDTFGMVVVHAISEVSDKAIVYLANDEERELFSVPPRTLKPSFVQTPLYASGSPEADACASLLTTELHRSLYEAALVAPLVRLEQEQRTRIEEGFAKCIEDASTLDLIGLLSQLHTSTTPPPPLLVTADAGAADTVRVAPSTSSTMLTTAPVVFERQYSTPSVYTPNPSIAVTSSYGFSTLRGNALFEERFTVALSITRASRNSHVMYVGLTTSTSTFPERVEEVATWEDSWALCSCDSVKTNSVNCCVEPSMIFSENVILYDSQDLLYMTVDRPEGTISFSRARKGKLFDFGVLFEGIPADVVVRPLIVCGPDTVVVFSFMDGVTFPCRNTFPISNFVAPYREQAPSTTCSVCEAVLSSVWYGGEDNLALCELCFKTWQLPKELFYTVRSPSGWSERVPPYLVSRHSPETLLEGAYLEFEESTVLAWSPSNSVNAESSGASCVAVFDECFAVTEPLSAYGVNRIDISLSYLAAVPGHPFSGLLPFTPLWRDSEQCTYSLQSESLAMSSSVFPRGTRTLFSIHVNELTPQRAVSFSGVFVGVTNLSETVYTVTRADLEQMCTNNTVWGTWCDSKDKISSRGVIYVLVDSIHNTVMVSSSLAGLYYNPFVITCNVGAEEDSHFRVILFSHDACGLRTEPGLTSYHDAVEPSAAPVAIALVPETFTAPKEHVFTEGVVLLDTVQRTEEACSTAWEYAQGVLSDGDGMLFHLDDTVTMIQQGTLVQVYCQGILVASITLNEEQAAQRHRLLIYLGASGLSATFVPPLFGKTHLGRVVKVHGPDVCELECVAEEPLVRRRYVVRKKDVRFCALAASNYPRAALKEGTHVAFKSGGLQLPKRGTIVNTSNEAINVCDEEDDRTITAVSFDHCFLLNNEGKYVTNQALYPLVTPPTSTVTRAFEVGKSKYRIQKKGSYNGIIFDCKASDTVDLLGLSVLSHTTGRHRVDVFFKKGTHKNFEREPRAWTTLFTQFVEMNLEHYFSVSFAAVHIEAGSTFALYINTSHNCGVGFYCEEDGCQGDVGSELDDDGTITVYLGRKSGSSNAFGDFGLDPRGFCGTILYKQSKGAKPPLIEGAGQASQGPVQENGPAIRGDLIALISRPPVTAHANTLRFTVEVLKVPVRVEHVRLPVQLLSTGEVASGLVRCVVSMFYTKLPDDDAEYGVGGAADGWHWAWNCRVVLSHDSPEVCLCGADLRLAKGKYLFAVVARRCLLQASMSGVGVQLFQPSDSQYSRRNSLVSVEGLYGELLVETDAPAVSGELHTMTTGSFLNQNNSASYNGIMFDIRSKQDITLEEIYCISQTTADHVTVRLFWKEGSMEGAEKSHMQWREVATKELQLVDKQPFSVGSLYLRMRANQTYAVFINTTSSCGVRFYNSSDGHVGEIGDEFENDGIVSVYVGRKSESSTPFSEIPVEPRAFRGKILYRTFILSTSETMDQAMFSYLRAFIVTRMLVALSSYVDSSDASTDGHFSYDKLLATVATLATSPNKSISDLHGAEKMLASLLRDSSSEEIRSGVVTVALPRDSSHLQMSLGKGDLALLTNPQKSSTSQLVRLLSDADPSDSTFPVHVLGGLAEETAAFRVPRKRLLPVTKCWQCQLPYVAEGPCSACGGPHLPPPNEDARITAILADRVMQQHDTTPAEALQMAKGLLQKPVEGLESVAYSLSIRESHITVPTMESTVSPDGSITFAIPTSRLLTEEDNVEGVQFTCPFVFHTPLRAYVALQVHATAHNVSLFVVTDYPLREHTNLSPRYFRCCLSYDADAAGGDSVGTLTPSPVLFTACGGACGELAVELVKRLDPSSCASHNHNGVVKFTLTMVAAPPPPLTPTLDTPSEPWAWENGAAEADLQPGTLTFLAADFSASSWPRSKPHFCTFMVESKGLDKAVFLEVHVIEVYQPRPLWGDATRTQTRTKTRKPFSLASGEVVTLGFSEDDGFFVYDEDDVVRCQITPEELRVSSKSAFNRIGFVCVHQEKVLAMLSVPDDLRRSARAANAPEHPTRQVGSDYEPAWEVLDESQVRLSKNKLTASCCSEQGGQAVLGSPMPDRGMFAFVIQLERRDRPLGASLGSGHFAGVALSSFSQTAPHFGELKTMTDKLWVVQDVQDGDSLPTQAPIPALEREEKTNELFGVGTKLLFIVDRNAGTLSFGRDEESPRVVFQDLPHNEVLRPFVRLDHTDSSATLSRFSHTQSLSLLSQPSLERAATSQPLTASLLRRFPLAVVLKLFPVFQCVVNALPTAQAARLECCWNDVHTHSRFDYRVAKAVETMVEHGCFSPRLMYAPRDALNEVVSPTLLSSLVALLTEEGNDSIVSLPGRHSGEVDVEGVLFRLPPAYEVLGRVHGTNMLRLLFLTEEGSPAERTLHLMYLDDPASTLHSSTCILPHPSVLRQRTILPSVNCANACGVVVDGWFDCTLAASDSLRLDEQQEKRIFSAIMFAVEHWHLHGLPHGHLTPANVHLRITHGIVVNCCLWNLHYLDRSSPYASNTLREQGVRDFKADLGSCALLLRSLHSIIQADPTVQRCVQLLDEGVLSVSEILQESDVFQDTTEEGGLEGPTGTLKTGARLRGGSGSYNGIMFDVVAKSTAVRVTKLTFVPDTNSTALVSLFTKPMSFLGSENDSSVWTKVYEKEMDLKDNVDTTVDGFDPITISACSKAGFFLHTTSGSGVLFYSENEGVQAGMGQVEEENGDIGITVGKKCESLIPFTAIQNQKRLLKGSITYTLITRANGPRSSLIYSFDEKSHGWPAKSNSTVEPVRVEGGDGVGLHLLSSGPSSLVLFPSKKALWVPSSRVHATSYNEAGAGLPEMERELCTLRRKRNERVLSDHCPERYVAGMSLRPVSFYSVSASAESVSHPSMQPGAWWWSEPLSECVTLSLWHATQVDCNVYLFQGGFDAARVAQGKNLMEGKAALFLRVDPTLKCVVVTSVKAKRRVVRVEGFPIRVAVRAGKSIAAAGSCQLFAYAHIPETWRRRHVTGHCTAVCLNPVDVNAATARADDTLVSTFDCVARISSSAAAADGREEGGMPNVEILAGPPTSVRLFALPDDPATATPVAPTLIANTAEQTHQTLSHRHPLNVWMESQQAAPRDNMADVLLSVNTPALKGDQRTVTQILHSAPAPATVLSPRFTATEAHEVLLKLRYPRQRAVAVSLVHPMNLHSPVDLPYATFHTLDGVSDGEPDGEEVYLHLHIDLLSQRILLRASSGTCFDAVSDKSALSELQLSFTLFSPGTSVEIVEWRVSLPRVEEPMSVKRFGKALGCLESTAVPANQAQTVGVLTRHSARMNAPATRENSLTATKQMEVLIVSYARVLLEKALAAQDGARRAVQRRLHYLLSFTSLRSSHSISGILEGEAKQGSFDLVAQACANLSSPSLLQPPQSVETSVNIVANAMTMEVSREALTTVFGPSIALLLLRTATVFSRATRHAALNCAQELLSNEKYPLPPHELLATHLGPLLRMMGGLCKRGRMSSAVVQIGVTLVANLVQRYAKERPSLPPPGARSAIPYQIIVCTRAVIESITRVPPQPLPAAMTRPAKPDHRINCTFTIRPLTSQGHVPEYGWFTEENRDPSGHKSFEVSLAWPRHGAVIVGWELNDGGSEAAPEARPEQSRYATEEEPLPSCGYYIEPVYGKVFVCVGRKREASALRVKAKAGDVVIVSTCYRQREITVSLRRENRKMLSTTFNLATHESIALPFYFAQNKADAVLHVQGLRSGSINLDVGEMYADLLRNPAAQDEEAPPQSYEFYEELNLFWRDMISKDGKFTMDTEDGKAGPSTLVLTHELAAYTHLSSFVGAGALAEETSIDCLRPYFKRLKLFDALTAAFSPLINLQRKSELFDIFRVLKNLCSKETEEAFQETIMRPFQNRQGRKVHVTVHAMQAQPSASLGPFPTLMRSVFGQLYLQLHRSTIDTFFASPMFTVKLAGFGSTDAGGPYRDVLSQLATEIMTGHPSGQFQLNPLFIQCGRGGATAIMPNPGLMSSSQVPLMLEFLGKLLASFFITNDLLAVEFPPLFWKLLLSEETSIKDLAVLDPDIVQQLKPEELMERTEEELEERFPGIGETWKALVSQNPSRTQDDTLPPTSPEAATLLSDSIVNSELSRFVEAMTFIQQGFDEVLPLYTLQAFRWQKVELQICGTQKLSFDAFRDECDVQLPENEAEMFLGVLESMTDDDRRLLLRFTTGQSRLPLKARIKVQHNGSKNSLPTSSTCFFTLRLPSYTTAAIMKERLLYAVRQCKAIDADGQARENLILDV